MIRHHPDPTPAAPAGAQDDELAFLALPPPTDRVVATPASWEELAVEDPRSVPREVARLVRRRLRRFPALAPHGARLRQELTALALQASASRAVLVALMSEPADDEVLSASLVISTAPALHTPDGSPARTCAQMRTVLARPGHDVAVVRLAQAPAVRVRHPTVHGTPVGHADQGRHGRGLLVQYHAAVPGCDARTVLSFASPALAVAQELETLFDLVARSFHYRWEPAPAGVGASGDGPRRTRRSRERSRQNSTEAKVPTSRKPTLR